MAYKEKEIEKLYYSIGEVAEQFNVAPSLIRFWESEFDLIRPKKNRKGNRQFTKEDIDNVRTIYHLVKEKGFTLQGAKEMLRNDDSSVKDKIDLIDSLKSVRKFLNFCLILVLNLRTFHCIQTQITVTSQCNLIQTHLQKLKLKYSISAEEESMKKHIILQVFSMKT